MRLKYTLPLSYSTRLKNHSFFSFSDHDVFFHVDQKEIYRRTIHLKCAEFAPSHQNKGVWQRGWWNEKVSA